MTSAFPARIFETVSRTANRSRRPTNWPGVAEPADASRAGKKVLIDPLLGFEEYCERAMEYQWQCVNDDEYEGAVTAFRERRAPEYGRDYL